MIFGRKPIAGTCGGLNNMTGGGSCEICGGDPNRCEGDDAPAPGAASSLSFDATRR
ncbi:MAG: (Na+)-NQR maturation NqrM [Gammaproteobacteria bacterium]|nr:(Na+)-NQR maturation NqrM [Gammaproteobacteria bacterium]